MVAVRNNLIVDDGALEQVDCEFVAVRIAIQNASPLYVSTYYRPPDEPADRLEKFEAALDQLLSKTDRNNKATLLIGGDFNIGDVDWENGMVKENSKKKSVCEQALNIINYARLTQLQKEPTRQDQVLDLLCTSNPSLLKSIQTVPGISDHDGIAVADFYLRAHINKKPPHSIWSYGHAPTGTLCTRNRRNSALSSARQPRPGILNKTGMLLKHT